GPRVAASLGEPPQQGPARTERRDRGERLGRVVAALVELREQPSVSVVGTAHARRADDTRSPPPRRSSACAEVLRHALAGVDLRDYLLALMQPIAPGDSLASWLRFTNASTELGLRLTFMVDDS